jgi:hypothetical protein
MTNENKAVEYDSMTKEELIGVIKSKDQAYENLKIVMDNNKADYENSLKNQRDNNRKVIDSLNKVITFYRNKLSVIKDICNLEGGEK